MLEVPTQAVAMFLVEPKNLSIPLSKSSLIKPKITLKFHINISVEDRDQENEINKFTEKMLRYHN